MVIELQRLLDQDLMTQDHNHEREIWRMKFQLILAPLEIRQETEICPDQIEVVELVVQQIDSFTVGMIILLMTTRMMKDDV